TVPQSCVQCRKAGGVFRALGQGVLGRGAEGQMQVGGKALDTAAAGGQHVIDAGNEKFLVLAGVQVLGAGVQVGGLVLERVGAAEGVMADHLFFHRAADQAVGPVLQVAVGRRVGGEGQQCPVGALGEVPLPAEVVKGRAEEQMIAVIEEHRHAVRQI